MEKIKKKKFKKIEEKKISSTWYTKAIIYFWNEHFFFHNDINLLISSFSIWWAFNKLGHNKKFIRIWEKKQKFTTWHEF